MRVRPSSICFLNSSCGRAISIEPFSERTSTGRDVPEKKLRRRMLLKVGDLLGDRHDFLGFTVCRSCECGATCAGEPKFTRACPPDDDVPCAKLCCDGMLRTLQSLSLELAVEDCFKLPP